MKDKEQAAPPRRDGRRSSASASGGKVSATGMTDTNVVRAKRSRNRKRWQRGVERVGCKIDAVPERLAVECLMYASIEKELGCSEGLDGRNLDKLLDLDRLPCPVLRLSDLLEVEVRAEHGGLLREHRACCRRGRSSWWFIQ